MLVTKWKTSALRLNPFRTGRGLSTEYKAILFYNQSLNPFRTGRGLSTNADGVKPILQQSLNPFRTGRGLSTHGKENFLYFSTNSDRTSQLSDGFEQLGRNLMKK